MIPSDGDDSIRLTVLHDRVRHEGTVTPWWLCNPDELEEVIGPTWTLAVCCDAEPLRPGG